ncbi:MAG TPA: biotin/lipoyl-binding protein, partial [Giesbergeria sp.]|nr:biotin/lipoyl-binding protein [Giesbergeria sp.]
MAIQWKNWASTAAVVAGAALLLTLWAPWRSNGPPEGLVSGNGRIEATEIAVAGKLAGRLQEVRVGEGDFVQAGQVLARLQVEGLQAQHDEARARLQQAHQAVATAQVQVAQAQGNHQAALAQVVQRETDLQSARRRLPRTEQLARDGFLSDQVLEDEHAKLRNLEAALAAARAQARAAEAG